MLRIDHVQVAEAWRRAQVLIDPKLGVLKHVKPLPNAPGIPHLFRYTAVRRAICDETGRILSANLSEGTGFKRDPMRARMAAVGEAVERYCVTVTSGHALRKASYVELGEAAVDPLTITRFTREQYAQPNFPFRPVDRTTSMMWVQGNAIPSETPSWIPADLVFMPSPQNWNIRDLLSTGLACGMSEEQARYAGLCEVIERDAFTIMWLLRIPFPRVDINSITDTGCLALIQEFARYGVRITINDLTTDLGIPTFLVTGETERSWPRVWIAANTALHPIDAMQGALEEAFGGLAFLMHTSRRIPDQEKIVHINDHAFYYADGKEYDQLRFFLEAPMKEFDPNRWDITTAQTYGEACSVLVDRISRRGYNIFAVDLTTLDVREAGLHVARVIIPQFQYLYMQHPCLDCPRMVTVGEMTGLGNDRPYNCAPHPFP